MTCPVRPKGWLTPVQLHLSRHLELCYHLVLHMKPLTCPDTDAALRRQGWVPHTGIFPFPKYKWFLLNPEDQAGQRGH